MLEEDVREYCLLVRVEAMHNLDVPSRVLNLNQRISREALQQKSFDFVERCVYEMLRQLAYKAEQEMWSIPMTKARPEKYLTPRIWAEEYQQTMNAVTRQQLDNVMMQEIAKLSGVGPTALGADTPLNTPKKPEPEYNPSNAYRLDTRDLTEETNNAMLPVIAAIVIDL
jgi:hypothetical protein